MARRLAETEASIVAISHQKDTEAFKCKAKSLIGKPTAEAAHCGY